MQSALVKPPLGVLHMLHQDVRPWIDSVIPAWGVRRSDAFAAHHHRDSHAQLDL